MNESEFPYTYTEVLQTLRKRLHEPAPARAQILSGPRQVGKTTLLGEIANEWADQAIYAPADAPEASLSGWWENLWSKAERLAAPRPAVLLIDEIQGLPDWSRLLKSKLDHISRYRIPLHVVVSGSSALQLGHGARETMAGRFERLRLLHWPVRELVKRFQISAEAGVEQAVRYGGYPGAVVFLPDYARWRNYIKDSIVEPAIGRDVLMMEAIRKPALLRQVFAVCVGHPAEIISIQKICGQLTERGALDTVAHYLHVLEEACLIAAVPKYSLKVVRQRAAPPKLVILNNALLSIMGTQEPPRAGHDFERWGRWVENACIALAWNAGQNPCYWRTEPLEIDMILNGSWGRWAVEIKTGSYGHRDLAGVLEFCRRYVSFRPLILCEPGYETVARQAGITCITWSSFLLNGLLDAT
ncbi:ATP-binding protein [bacterium]|nr:MAG: ATP-binding protein [bacterium]